ncbi:MAG TPA: DUF4199 domain-containing protein [Chitinophagaceae bacterium]|nr:DUF4199 domain-containing protein [Chitinophagaceae bacterium]MCB0741247.1 DUF4199 domain-containing protein [Chitinophagaceae bacterium]HQV05523.1 DUF4199 domain-containing protein [Chitinophagaceae bacterium]
MQISPALKGIIISVLMIGLILYIYSFGKNANPNLQYFVYITYAIGIVWALVSFRKTAACTGRYGNLFSHGFKFFIIVTLFMTIFYWIFNNAHPEFKETMATAYKEQLDKKVVNNEMLPTEVDDAVAAYKKQYTLRLVSGAIFGYLIMGVAVTAFISVFLIKRKK